jgi:methyl-accepting chemotaxis protein
MSKGDAAVASNAAIAQLRAGLGGATPALVVVFASTKQPLAEVAARFEKEFAGAVVVGASTAGEFTERGDAKGGIAAIAVAGEFRAYAAMGVGLRAAPEAAVSSALASLPQAEASHPFRTALLLLDPLAGNGEEVTLMVAAALGEQPIAGGAAGDDLEMTRTIVSCGARAESDALVVVQLFSKEPLGLGVCHGHRPLSKPLRVSRAHGAVVEEIEGRPAWDVWLEQTKAEVAPADEGGFLLQYEAGLASGEGYKIRAPLSRSGGSIQFACGIPEGSVIRITESDPPSQVASAIEAARRAKERLGGREAAGAIVFDCICRNLILGDRFVDAVSGIAKELGDAPIAGFETYGEVAMDAGDMSGFHNTTSVVLAFPK